MYRFDGTLLVRGEPCDGTVLINFHFIIGHSMVSRISRWNGIGNVMRILCWLGRGRHFGVLWVLCNLDLLNLLVETVLAGRTGRIGGIGSEYVCQWLRELLARA